VIAAKNLPRFKSRRVIADHSVTSDVALHEEALICARTPAGEGTCDR
jgi:hypothetical protein